MIKRLALLFTSLLLLTACGSTSNEVDDLKYDEVELIHYQTCISAATGGMKNFFSAQFYMDNAILACKKYKPTKS
jgi:hypothetical protein